MWQMAIGLGKYVLADDPKWKAIPENCIIDTISHTGNRKERRTRDFIPSDISKNEEESFGRAHLYY